MISNTYKTVIKVQDIRVDYIFKKEVNLKVLKVVFPKR